MRGLAELYRAPNHLLTISREPPGRTTVLGDPGSDQSRGIIGDRRSPQPPSLAKLLCRAKKKEECGAQHGYPVTATYTWLWFGFSEKADFAGDARKGDTEIKEVSLVGSNKVLDEQLPGPWCHLGAEGKWVRSRLKKFSLGFRVWSQAETGLPTLRHSLLSTDRKSGAWWMEASPVRMGCRTQWWYPTLKPKGTKEGKVHFAPPPFPNLLPSDLDIWPADLFCCPALMSSHSMGSHLVSWA